MTVDQESLAEIVERAEVIQLLDQLRGDLKAGHSPDHPADHAPVVGLARQFADELRANAPGLAPPDGDGLNWGVLDAAARAIVADPGKVAQGHATLVTVANKYRQARESVRGCEQEIALSMGTHNFPRSQRPVGQWIQELRAFVQARRQLIG